MQDTQRSEHVYTKQRRIADIARQRPTERLTALNHYLDVEWLTEAYHRVRRDSAPGVDGQSVSDYGKHLEEVLPSLLHRAKCGSYVAPPVKRVHLPKDGSKETRPIGMPTCEDKVLQRAVAMLLEPSGPSSSTAQQPTPALLTSAGTRSPHPNHPKNPGLPQPPKPK